LNFTQNTSGCRSNLQLASEKFEAHRFKWQTCINADKTEALCFSCFKNHRKSINNFQVANNRVKWKDSVKYFSVTLSSNFTFGLHHKKVLIACNWRLQSLRFIFKFSHLSLKCKLILYKSFILSLIGYGCQATDLNKRHNFSHVREVSDRMSSCYIRSPYLRKHLNLNQNLTMNKFNKNYTKASWPPGLIIISPRSAPLAVIM